jgi:hypothetical protein
MVQRLVQQGLIAELPAATKRASAKLALTESGRVIAARLPPARITLADVYREIVALRQQLEAVRTLVNAPAARSQKLPEVAPSAPLPADFGAALQTVLGELDRRARYGGLVPLPEVRKALAGLGLSREAFDAALLEHERAFDVDLKAAHDPRDVGEPEQGIPDDGRGLLYYVVRR